MVGIPAVYDLKDLALRLQTGSDKTLRNSFACMNDVQRNLFRAIIQTSVTQKKSNAIKSIGNWIYANNQTILSNLSYLWFTGNAIKSVVDVQEIFRQSNIDVGLIDTKSYLVNKKEGVGPASEKYWKQIGRGLWSKLEELS